MAVSTLVLTRNEEANLSACLESLRWCDDIVILDSLSTDRTEAIAHQYRARFIQRPFDGYASQRNFGLNRINYVHPWVLMVDADELVTPELAAEILATVDRAGPDYDLFRMRRKDMLMGRWIRRSSGYPTWFGRLARLGRVRVAREINEEYIGDGKTGLLHNHLLHYPFNKGFAYWLERHNHYSSLEAELLYREPPALPATACLLADDPAMRRKAAKNLLYSLPLRPVCAFLGLYVIRGGFLEGWPGLTFCALRAFYEFMIDCKLLEKRFRADGGIL